MRRIVVFALAAACGGSIPSITATQQIKDGASQAQQGLQSSNTGQLSAVGLQNFAGNLIGISDASGLDLSALPDPGAMSKKASPPPRQGGPQGAMAPFHLRSTADTSLVTGCIKPDPNNNNQGTVIKAGDPGCDAADHLEIDYVNGDQMNLVYNSSSALTYDLNVSVGAGNWSGTSLDYQATVSANNNGNTGITIHAVGGLRYGGDISSDFDFTYQVSQTADSNGRVSALQVTGTATDHPSSVHLTFDWTTSIESDVHGTLSALSWSGNQQVDLLDAAGAVQNGVKFSNVQVRAALQGSVTVITGFTAGGDVLWNGARAGSVVAKDAQDVVIRWTDGTDAPIDPIALFGSPLQ
ncbi:MAG TPA: hypothetical protein VLW85_22890 [Myxococcales bacterium]|nr:hypothetical protein [Myxococcales bacterium]